MSGTKGELLPLPRNVEELQQVLLMMQGPETETIKRATAILKLFMKKADSVVPMMQQLKDSPILEVRQMAAVLMRKRLPALFKKLPEAAQNEVKAALLERLVAEPGRPVRLGVAALISSVAQRLVPDGKWPDLLSFLLNLSRAPKIEHREIAMLLFRALAENIGSTLRPHLKTLQAVFVQGLKDPNERVKVEALRAIGVLIEFVGESKEEVKSYREMVPPMVDVVKHCVTQGDADAAAVAFEVFDSLAESPVPILTQHIPVLVRLMAEVCLARSLDINIREKAATFICSIAEAYPAKMMKHKLVEDCLKCGFALAVEPAEDAIDPGEMTPQKIAVEIIDAIVLHVNRSMTFAPTMSHAIELVKSSNHFHRKGGFLILSVMAEGCSEQLTEHLPSLLGVICNGIKDPVPTVRASACVCLTQFADHMGEDMVKHHQVVIPHLFLAIDNSGGSSLVRSKACVSLEVFCENMGKEILPYLDGLMKKLVMLLQTADEKVQQAAISAIKATAAAAQEAFLPYAEPIMKMMMSLLAVTKDEHLVMRARAMECCGSIALAIGKDKFNVYFQDVLRAAVAGMELDFFELREATYHFFGGLAEAYENDFTPLLPTVMSFLLATCHSDDGVVIYSKKGALGDDPEMSDPDDEEDLDDFEDESKRLNFSIRTGALDEKVAAVTCMATIVESVGKPWLPYLEKSLTALDELQEYPHHYVRHAVVTAYAQILALMHKEFPNATPVKQGEEGELHKNSRLLVDKLMPAFQDRLTEEEDKNVAAAALEAIIEVTKMFGLGGIKPHLKKIQKALMMFLKEEAPCQGAPDDFQDDDEHHKDHDEIVIDTVTDLISALAQAMGPKFEPNFKKMFEHIMKFARPARPAHSRSMAIGCVAEVAEHLGATIAPYLPTLFPVVINSLSDADVGVRRNSAFCAGVLAASCPAAIPYYPEVVKRLPPLFDIDEKKADDDLLACRDNACSALGRVMRAAPAGFPMDQAVPLFLKGLPIRSDYLEAKPAYECFVWLFQSHAPLMFKYFAQCVNILVAAVPQPQLQDFSKETVAVLVALSKSLIEQKKAEVTEVLNAVPAPQREAFLKKLSE